MQSKPAPWAPATLLLLSVACSGAPERPYPTDAELISVFEGQRSVLDELLVQSDDSAALVSLGLKAGRSHSFGTETAVYFESWYRDLVGPGGCAKGFAYLDPAPTETVDVIGDHLAVCPPEELSIHRTLGENWYLYYSASN